MCMAKLRSLPTAQSRNDTLLAESMKTLQNHEHVNFCKQHAQQGTSCMASYFVGIRIVCNAVESEDFGYTTNCCLHAMQGIDLCPSHQGTSYTLHIIIQLNMHMDIIMIIITVICTSQDSPPS